MYTMAQLPRIATLAPDPPAPAKPTRQQAEDAVRTLIAWAGEDPDREELRATPSRVVEAYGEYFRGYHEDPLAWLSEADVEMSDGYDDMVLLTGIRVQSFCEHHITPFEGTASVAYLPDHRLVGLSRLARVVDTLARRLQTQEALTEQISQTIQDGLAPRGIAVLIAAEHQCISFRGIRQSGIATVTTRFVGSFKTDPDLQSRFIALARPAPPSARLANP